MRPHIIVISLVLALLTLGLILFLAATAGPPRGTIPAPGQSPGAGAITRLPDADPNPYADFYIPDFTLTDRKGQPITQEVLDGHYTVVDFFFTSCPLICPAMNAEMQRVQEATRGTKLRMLSLSIDGGLDTPDVIDRYATDHDAEPDRWRFATGDPAVVADLALRGLKFLVGSPEPDPKTGARNINHPSRLILVGPDRHVVGLYRYDDPDEVAELIEKAKTLTR